MADVFDSRANDTPVLSAGWTVQSSPAGEENLVKGSPALKGTAAFQASVAAPTAPSTGADTATLAKLTDVQALRTAVNALNAALQAAGLELTS